MIDSFYQAQIMKLFGVNNFGWRMASVLTAAIAIILIYLLTKSLFNKQTAALASIVFASSHYLLAFTHIGYNNLHTLIPTLLTFVFLAKSIKKPKNWIYPFLGGIFSGFGFYTFYSARLILPVSLFFFSSDPLKTSKKSFILLLALCFSCFLFLSSIKRMFLFLV